MEYLPIAEPGFELSLISNGQVLEYYALWLHRTLVLEGTQQVMKLNPCSLKRRTPGSKKETWPAHTTNKKCHKFHFTEHYKPLHNLPANVVSSYSSPGGGWGFCSQLHFSIAGNKKLLDLHYYSTAKLHIPNWVKLWTSGESGLPQNHYKYPRLLFGVEPHWLTNLVWGKVLQAEGTTCVKVQG